MQGEYEEDEGSKSIHLGNSVSEFTLVVGDRSKVSNEFGK